MKAMILTALIIGALQPGYSQSGHKETHVNDHPPKNLVRFSYYDGDRYVKLKGNDIDLKLQDRVFKNAKMQDPFDVLLCIKNISRYNVYVPREIFCWFDSGFGSNKYYFESSDTLPPGKMKKIPVHVQNNWREFFEKGVYPVSLFTSDTTEFRYPIRLQVHFVKQDTLSHRQ